MSNKLHEVILHCQKKLKKEQTDDRLLHYLGRLSRLRINVTDLAETGIGRTVNQLGRNEGKVGHEARKLVRRWKAMVADTASGSSESEESSENEEDNQSSQEDGMNNEDDTAESYGHTVTEEPEDEDDQMCIVEKYEPEHVDTEPEPYFPNETSNPDSESDSSSSDHLPIAQEHQYDTVYKKESQIEHDKKISRHESDKLSKEHEKKQKSSSKIRNKDFCDESSETLKINHGYSPLRIKTERESDDESEIPNEDRRKRRQEGTHKSTGSSNSEGTKSKSDKRNKHKNHGKRKNNDSSMYESSGKKAKEDEEVVKIKKEPSSPKKTDKKKIVINGEIDSTSGFNFSDVLGSLNAKKPSSSNPKAVRKSKPKIVKTENQEDSLAAMGYSPVVPKKERRSRVENGEAKSRGENGERKNRGENGERKNRAEHGERKNRTEHGERKNRTEHGEKRNRLENGERRKEGIESVKITPKESYSISPNYKPSVINLPSTSSSSNDLALNDEDRRLKIHSTRNGDESNFTHEDLSKMMSSRHARTKVFSGNRVGAKGHVPKLFDLCMQIVKDNLHELGSTGNIPYEILKPALERASAKQLKMIEEINPYLAADTDQLWQFHTNRDFRGARTKELESWREVYDRCEDERARKFSALTKKMKMKEQKAVPVRKAKLAYVDSNRGPRFSKKKAETIKNGMTSLKMRDEKGPNSSGSASGSSDGANIRVEPASVIIAGDSRSASSSSSQSSREAVVAKSKPKKAPLMQKTMKLIRTIYRR